MPADSRRKLFLTVLIAAWLIFLHLVLIAFILKEPVHQSIGNVSGIQLFEYQELTVYKHERRGYLARRHTAATISGVWFIGDSHMDRLDVSRISPSSQNLGIGGDTTKDVLLRISDYEPLTRADAIVIGVGFNDLLRNTPDETAANLRLILEKIDYSIQVLLLSSLPVNENRVDLPFGNAEIAELNQHYSAISGGIPQR